MAIQQIAFYSNGHYFQNMMSHVIITTVIVAVPTCISVLVECLGGVLEFNVRYSSYKLQTNNKR